ncbi:MAG: helix-turn-helix transcriptional regulator [Solirubrobacteraceae bacterium]
MTARQAPPGGVSDALILAIARERAAGRPAHMVAARVPIHPSELSRWVNGRRSPTRNQAARLAKILGEPIGDLFPSLIVLNENGGAGTTTAPPPETSSADQGRRPATAEQGHDRVQA